MVRDTTTKSAALAAIVSAILCTLTFAGGALADEARITLAEASPADAVNHATSTMAMPATDRDEQRIVKLHDKLEITTSQEGLWAQLAQVMRTNDDRIDELAADRHARAASMTAVEDLRSYGEITEAHAAGIRAFLPPFENLYNSMSTTQKATADTVFRHGGKQEHKAAM